MNLRYLRNNIFAVILFFLFFSGNNTVDIPVFSTKNGTISFVSEAPLEVIKAQSSKLMGAIDLNKKTFAFQVSMLSFDGFNSPLQKEHFNENYVESDKYPMASFKGKIVEDANYSEASTYSVRAKGMLSVHGIEKERIIKVSISVSANEIKSESMFTVPMEDHKINIPKIVNQKIAEVITVKVKTTMLPKK